MSFFSWFFFKVSRKVICGGVGIRVYCFIMRSLVVGVVVYLMIYIYVGGLSFR